MYPFESNLHLAGFILAGTAAVSALYLIPLSDKAKAWLMFSAALVLLAFNRGLQRFSNGGSVAMESYPGKGSTFTVTLPSRS